MSEKAYAVVGYIRVSTSEQADSGAGLEAQRAAIRSEAERRGWQLVHVFEDAGASGKSLNGRRGLQRALEAIEAGTAEGLVVAKLDRLSRSLLDFAALMERARKGGWNLIALDLGVDTSTPAGEMMASVLATFAQFERRLIGQRTKDALAIKRAQGVVLGRPAEDERGDRRANPRTRTIGDERFRHRPRTERRWCPYRHGSRALASPRRHAGAVLGSFGMNANYSVAGVPGAGVDPCENAAHTRVPDACGDPDREPCCSGSGCVAGGGCRPDTSDVLSVGYAASCNPPHGGPITEGRVCEVLRTWPSRAPRKGQVVQVVHHRRRLLLDELERQAFQLEQQAFRPNRVRRLARERLLPPLGANEWTLVRAARTRRHHRWGGAAAGIHFPAQRRHGHHLEGS